MHPNLFRLGGFPVGTHEFFVALGVASAALVFTVEARRRGKLDERLYWVVMGALLCGGLAARMATAWRLAAVAPDASLLDLVARGGRSILGGLAGAYAGALLTKRMVGYRGHTGDLFAPAVAAGMAVGRWGCFLTEQIGTPTSLPWGFRPPAGLATLVPNCPDCATGAAMHPSFLYEIAFHLAMFAWLWWWLRARVAVEGELLKIYLLCYAVFRFLVEFVRGNDVIWGGLTWSQLFLIPATLALLSYFWRRRRRSAPARGPLFATGAPFRPAASQQGAPATP